MRHSSRYAATAPYSVHQIKIKAGQIRNFGTFRKTKEWLRLHRLHCHLQNRDAAFRNPPNFRFFGLNKIGPNVTTKPFREGGQVFSEFIYIVHGWSVVTERGPS